MCLSLVLAVVRLASPFTDGAVLQRDMKVPIWGTAAVGEKVTVSFAGQVQSAVAASDGKWRVDLEPLSACCEGRDLTVSSVDQSNNPNSRTIKDVLVGEVWLCSGQSNMGIPFWG